MKSIELLIPVYNEQEVLQELFKEILSIRDGFKDRYNVLFTFVNDGSKDGSHQMLHTFAETNPGVQIVRHARNFGHEATLVSGLDYATGDCVIMMDADLQDPPATIYDLVKEWEQGYEVVYAQRRTRKDTPMKKFTAYLFYRLLKWLSNITIPKDTGNFRLIDKKVVLAIREFREHNRFMRGLVSFVGFKQKAVLFDRADRFAGKTHYPWARMVKLALDGITSFSTVPLQFITQVGMVAVLGSVIGIVYALYMYFFRPDLTVSGWTLMMIAILFMGGVQLLMLGIIGTYIGRIYTEVQNRPIYVVAEVVKSKVV